MCQKPTVFGNANKHHNKAHGMFTQKMNSIQFWKRVSSTMKDIKSKLNLIAELVSPSYQKKLLVATILSMSYLKLPTLNTQSLFSCSDMAIYCEVAGLERNCSEILDDDITDNGKCCTYNQAWNFFPKVDLDK